MALLADFAQRLDLPGGPVWPALGQDNLWLAPASHVGLAIGSGGAPQFHLSLIRGETPDAPPPPFALLDLTLTAGRNLDQTLTELRDVVPGATVIPAQVDQTHLALGWESGAQADTDGPLIDTVWQDSGQARTLRQLDLDQGLALEAQLTTGINPLIFRGAASFLGVSARLNTVATADAALMQRVTQEIGSPTVTRDTLMFALLALGITQTVDLDPALPATSAAALADALADRIIAAWCAAGAQTPSGLPLYHVATDPAPATWDLSRTFVAPRWLPLDQHRETILSDHIARHGMDDLVTRRFLPRFPKGRHRITAYANMPTVAPGLHMLDVALLSPPNPPDRPAAAHAGGQIDPKAGIIASNISLALGETLSYQVTASAVIGQGADIRQVFGPARHETDQILTLTAADFGLRIIRHQVDPVLLSMAELTLVQRYDIQGATVETQIAVTESDIISVLPAEVTAGTLHLTAQEIDGTTEIALPPLPLEPLHITTALFPGYGRQAVPIIFDPPPTGVQGVDLRPGHAGNDDQQQTFAFDADRSERTYTYAAETPFQPGFRWRFTGTSDWQLHEDPGQPLRLDQHP